MLLHAVLPMLQGGIARSGDGSSGRAQTPRLPSRAATAPFRASPAHLAKGAERKRQLRRAIIFPAAPWLAKQHLDAIDGRSLARVLGCGCRWLGAL